MSPYREPSIPSAWRAHARARLRAAFLRGFTRGYLGAALHLAIALLCGATFVGHAGCGASVVSTHARAATVSAVAAQGAARVVRDAALADAQTSCPAAGAECMAALRARWAPADAAVASTRATLLAWVEALEIARVAGDGDDLWVPLATAAARLVSEWERMRAALAPLGVDLPALPTLVVQAAAMIGGE